MTFQTASKIISSLLQHGYEAYFVGGAVRDSILNQPIGDIDIATSATPQQIMKIFPKIIPVGIEHGTVIVRMEGESFEVTTFRKEGKYNDHRHPESVAFISSINEDLLRRDFTMNAIAMSLDGTILDPFNGKQDIKKKLIRTVGSADERFQEDPLRMMRGIRFVSTLGFKLDSETRNAIVRNKQFLEKIAVERISIEFEKMLLGDSLKLAIYELLRTELFLYLPGLEGKRESLYEYSTLHLYPSPTIVEQWVLLCYLLKVKDPSLFLKKWKLSRHKLTEIKQLLALLYEGNIEMNHWFIYDRGIWNCLALNRLLKALGKQSYSEDVIEQLYEKLPIKSRKELVINGNDLQKWLEQKPGPWIESMLKEIEMAIINYDIPNNKKEVKEWVYWKGQSVSD